MEAIDYELFWTGFQNKIKNNRKIQEVFDDTINDTGVGKRKNSYVFTFRPNPVAAPYWIVPHLIKQKGIISVDMYFRKKRKYVTEILTFFVENKDVLEDRLEYELYISDLDKTEVRMSYRKPIFEINLDKLDEYYSWYIDTMLKMYDAFEGLRLENGFFPEQGKNDQTNTKKSIRDYK